MIKRTVEISQQPVHLTVKHEQLVLIAKDERRTQLASIPCEDIGVLLVEHPGTTYTHAALTTLLTYDVAVIVCGRNHLPAGLLLPFGEHSEVVWRIDLQTSVSKPLRKRLWQQIIRAKILAQAENIPPENPKHAALKALARSVRSGDPNNVEAQAARKYWSALFPDHAFKRDTDGDGINSLLNYGYAVLRAAVARSIVSAGLLPALGIHHRNRSNAFCLADDLMEPLRPMIDARVHRLATEGILELNPDGKRSLLELLADRVRYSQGSGPLLVALHHLTASLVKCYDGTAQRLTIPIPIKTPDAETADADAPQC